MQVIALRKLREFWTVHPQAAVPLRTWHDDVSNAVWMGPQDIKDQFGHKVDFLADDRVIFDISGNKYRLVARVVFRYRAVQIKFIGTHTEYDRINPETVQ